MPIAIFLVVSALVGGGVSVAAEGSLPGDALYAVKVGVNESVRGVFAVSGTAKANWDAKIALRRVEEAEELAAGGEVSAEVKAKLEANFEAHADRVRERIQKFQAEDRHQTALETSSNFEASLRAHENILARLSLNSLASKVSENANAMASIRAAAEAEFGGEAGSPEVETAAKGKLTATEAKIAEVEKFIARVEASAGAEAVVEAKAKVTLAKNAVTGGKAKIEAEAYGEAFVILQSALRLAQEAMTLVDIKANAEIRVRVGGGTNVGAPGGDNEVPEGGARDRGEANVEVEVGL